ncbi:sensor histidine kinase [Nocardioides speluncae]|uniref:sensor histidine kinase n=1 Tax=Nocardioides speluncae TaxID=2670337 RepID=UPI000D690DB5|nr:sensor histidine kinase [Nocardioides speluncae]
MQSPPRLTPTLLPQPIRLTRRGQQIFDLFLAGGLLLPVLAFPIVGMPWEDTLLSIGLLAPLFWRRQHPFAVVLAVSAVSLTQVLTINTALYAQIGLPITMYSVARFGTTLQGLVSVGIGFIGAVLASIDWLRHYAGNQLTFGAFTSYFISMSVVVIASWALGTLGRTRRAYVDALVERGERLEREAAQQAELAASDERARIAREMHDVVAHGLSVIVVQADGARYAAAKDPGAAVDALATISATGRDALAEMRKMLGLLRSDQGNGGTGTRPQPGLADLPFLVDEARAAGMDVDATLPPVNVAVPDGVALTAYRVVQEALTNVRKHAGLQAQVTVAVDVVTGPRGPEVRVDVADDGRGAAATDDGNGLGLAGMHERVVVHGGTLDVGPRPGGGYGVSARIPL